MALNCTRSPQSKTFLGRQTVQLRVKRTLVAVAFGIGTLIVTSCSPPPSVAVKQPGTGSGSTAVSPPASGSAEPPKATRAPTVGSLNFPKGAFTVAPKGTKGWGNSAATLESIGDQMDQAFAGLKDGMCDASVMFEVGGAQMTGKTTLKVMNSQVFALEYLTPATEAKINRLVSDGKSRVLHEGDKRQQMDPPPVTPTVPLDQAALNEWHAGFLRSMFGNYIEGRKVWGPLFRSWNSQQGTKPPVVEERTVDLNGKKRKTYRVTFRDMSGSDLEVIVDGVRLLPLTVRSVNANDRQLWTGVWSFGGKYNPKEFVVPTY